MNDIAACTDSKVLLPSRDCVSRSVNTSLAGMSLLLVLQGFALSSCSFDAEGCVTAEDCRDGRICQQGACVYEGEVPSGPDSDGNFAGGVDFGIPPGESDLDSGPSIDVVDFGAPALDSGPSIDVLDFGAPALDSGPSIDVLDFGTPDLDMTLPPDQDMTPPDMLIFDGGDTDDFDGNDMTLDGGHTSDMEDTSPALPDITPMPMIEVTPNRIDYGFVARGFGITTELRVENIGSSDLTLDRLELRAQPSQGFEVFPRVSNTPEVLPPGGSLTVDVTFAPTVSGNYGNDVEVESDAVNGALITVPLSGQSANTGFARCIFAGPETLDFGPVAVGSSRTLNLTIGNCNGSRNLEIQTVNLLGQSPASFIIGSALMPPQTLMGGDVIEVPITFTPSMAGRVTAQITIRHNALLVQAQTIVVVGEGQ